MQALPVLIATTCPEVPHIWPITVLPAGPVDSAYLGASFEEMQIRVIR